MKAIALLTVLLAAAICEKVDVNEILQNERLLKNYVTCLLEGTGCTPEGEDLRKKVPQKLENACEDCTEEQLKNIKAFFNVMTKNHPDLWEKLKNKYDPDGTLAQKWVEKHGTE